MEGSVLPVRKRMSGLKRFALNPATVKLIELIADMALERRHPEADPRPALGREVINEATQPFPDDPKWDAEDEADPEDGSALPRPPTSLPNGTGTRL